MILIIVGVVIFVIICAIILKPSAQNNGGSIDLFFIDEDENETVRAPVNNDDKYYKVYSKSGKQILITFATEYGFSEEVAKGLYDHLESNLEAGGSDENQYQIRLARLAWHKLIDLSKEQIVLSICSTTGDGVAPTESKEFFEQFTSTNNKDLQHLNFSVLALGDSNYPHFCRTGKNLDAQFLVRGSNAIVPRVDVDLEDWNTINEWFNKVTSAIKDLELESREDYITSYEGFVGTSHSEGSGKYSRTKPYLAKVVSKYDLTVTETPEQKWERQVVHVELDIPEEDALNYTAGDAVGIYPHNNPTEVGDISKILKENGISGDTQVAIPKSIYEPKPITPQIALKEALTRYYDLKTLKTSLIELFHQNTKDSKEKQFLTDLLKDGGSVQKNQKLKTYFETHEIVDFLSENPSAIKSIGISKILEHFKVIQPRYYSIASSPKVHRGKIHVAAAVLRYRTLGKERTGVCSTFMSDRVDVENDVFAFISSNPEFRLPENDETPIIMVGPGTGIAPFRAFIQERQNSKGLNLFYFGCRNENSDFLYKSELQNFENEGKIKLRTAFSRDQNEKIYVQHRIEEDKDLIWDLLENKGAHFYVCGDAKRMAGDVHTTLLKIFSQVGGRSEEEAVKYMENLEKNKRYQRDVWVT
eukprot:TRINITY_DN2650_c0_g1_i1.p1 TRINITY_DN2650_c0_g1~~TRINITY_DN2650_c0_g1_i1.p1  ORF type:complete len:644 (+),score=155.36 TRINITY_DN2650_c0_g1_i1:53-1984(+)